MHNHARQTCMQPSATDRLPQLPSNSGCQHNSPALIPHELNAHACSKPCCKTLTTKHACQKGGCPQACHNGPCGQARHDGASRRQDHLSNPHILGVALHRLVEAHFALELVSGAQIDAYASDIKHHEGLKLLRRHKAGEGVLQACQQLPDGPAHTHTGFWALCQVCLHSALAEAVRQHVTKPVCMWVKLQ